MIKHILRIFLVLVLFFGTVGVASAFSSKLAEPGDANVQKRIDQWRQQFQPPEPEWVTRYQGKVIKAISMRSKRVALTFDDGPLGEYASIAATLKAYNAKATFFAVGGRASDHRADAATVKDYEVGNHTWNHIEMVGLTSAENYRQVDLSDTALTEIFGLKPRWFRARGGKLDAAGKSAVFGRGHLIANWSVHGGDTVKGATANSIANTVLAGVKPGSIVLLHSTNPETRKALPIILRGLAERGYITKTLSELAACGSPIE